MKINKIIQFLFLIIFLNKSNILYGSNDSLIIDLSSQKYSEWIEQIDIKNIFDNIYPKISIVLKSPLINGEDSEKPIYDDKGFFNYYYRCIVCESEYTDDLYLEKWGVLDEECQQVKLINQVYIPIQKIVYGKEFAYSGGYISNIKWINHSRIILSIDKQMFEIIISE